MSHYTPYALATPHSLRFASISEDEFYEKYQATGLSFEFSQTTFAALVAMAITVWDTVRFFAAQPQT